MAISFGQLYEGVLSLEKGLIQLERDIENATCSYAVKCLMEEELINLRGQVDSLLDMEMDFQRIDFKELSFKIYQCLSCLNLELDSLETGVELWGNE